MSQTTRCPSCATLFKVVADQLRISDGWVRCGHCQQVFDASQSLQTVAAQPLLPDLPLDLLRAPPQPVVRPAAPPRQWGDGHSERRDVAPHPVQAPASAAPDAVVPRGLAQQTSDEHVLQVPEPEIPAFLAATDRLDGGTTHVVAAASAEPAFVVWSAAPLQLPVSEENHGAYHAAADEDDKPGLEETVARDGLFGSEAAEIQFPGGYELPAAVLPDSDLDWLDDEPEPEPEVRAAVADEAETDLVEPVPQSWDADASAGDAPSSLQAQAESDTADASDDAHRPSPGPDEEPVLPETQQLEDDASGTAPEPSFVRAARRQALWRKPAVRAMLGLLAIVLTAALLLQVALQQRNYLAAAWPQWRPYLEAACVPLQCRVGAYREIASVVVDSSSFDKLQGNDYQFVITLKNRSDRELEMPAVELTLTDAGDQPVLRRIFTLPDLSAPATLAARGEWAATLQMQLAPSDSARIASYRVLAFYP